ncbi:MAG: hypothetical protein ACRD0V_18745, partial [Acidimicrobiales bacterium]
MIIICTRSGGGDECDYCGGWLHTARAGGVAGPCGRYCGQDCAAGAQSYAGQVDAATHVHLRDLRCDCPTCTAAGHP